MCNLYNQTTAVEAMRHLFDGLKVAESAGTLARGKVYPDQLARSSATAAPAWSWPGRGGECRHRRAICPPRAETAA